MVATSAAPACSATFFRVHCRHEQLFDSEYKRSNRNRGRKILRCFPHCCPSHVERSFCGSSLQVAVEMHEPLAVDATTLFVFARFETVDLEDAPVIGDCISLQHLQGLSKNQTQPDAQWTQGVLVPSASTTSASTVFEFNGQTSAKWSYHWESGANKARRLTKHVLKAYVLYRRPSGGVRDDMVQVIGIVSSPPFTLVSYRRSWEGFNGVTDGTVMPPTHSSAPAMQVNGEPQSHDLHRIVQRQVSQAFHSFHNKAIDEEAKTEAHNNQRPQLRREKSPNEEEFIPLESQQWVWERRHASQLRPVKDLAVIYYFVSRTPMAFAMGSTRVRQHVCAAFEDYWTNQSVDRDALMQPGDPLLLLFPRFSGPRSTATPSSNMSPTDSKTINTQGEKLLGIVAKLSIWMLSGENIQRFRAFFDSCARDLLQKDRLRGAYLGFIDLLSQRAEVFWSQEITASESASLHAQLPSAANALHTLSEHILALSHVDVDFQWMWLGLREILQSPASPLWKSFVAQVRETFVRKQPKRDRLVSSESPSGLRGRWRLAAVATGDILHGVSIIMALLGIVQLQQVSIDVIGHHTLQINGDNSLLPEGNDWMTLVCDGIPRSASVMPLGLSTLVGFELSGVDYIGRMDGTRSRVQLEVYWWPCRTASAARKGRATRLVLTLSLSAPEYIHVTMELHYAGIDPHELASVELGSAKGRVGLRVQWTHAWQASAQYEDAKFRVRSSCNS